MSQFVHESLVEKMWACQPRLTEMIAGVIPSTKAISVELRHALRMLLNLQLDELDVEYLVVIEGLFQYRGPSIADTEDVSSALPLIYNVICTMLVLQKTKAKEESSKQGEAQGGQSIVGSEAR